MIIINRNLSLETSRKIAYRRKNQTTRHGVFWKNRDSPVGWSILSKFQKRTDNVALGPQDVASVAFLGESSEAVELFERRVLNLLPVPKIVPDICSRDDMSPRSLNFFFLRIPL